MRIENGLVFREDGQFMERTVRIRGGRFSAFCEDTDLYDARNCYVIPGLVDLHLHGALNADCSDASVDSLSTVAQYEAYHGITSFVPTTMTLPADQLRNIARSIKQYCAEDHNGASVLGYRLEGPFLSKEKCGSQETSALIPPDIDLLRELDELSGNQLRICDLAPELPGSLPFIDAVPDRIRVSIAHTACTYDTARAAMDHGAHHLTHMYNAMAPFQHREPGPIGAASDDPDCTGELIADGIHNHPSMVRNAFRIFGAKRICLISDSMEATGMPDGKYSLGGHDVFVKGKLAQLASGAIAASVTNLYDCMVTAVREMGIPLEDVVLASTLTPARYLGVQHEVGSISLGKQADVLIVDRDTLELRAVICRGRMIRN